MNATLAGSAMGGATRTPWHLWLVGGLTLLWNAVGGFSYTMTRFGMLEQLGMGEAEIAFFESAPVWSNAFWALGVWGAIAGSALILMRSRFAIYAVIVAIIGLIGSNYWQYGVAQVPESLQSPAMTLIIWGTTMFMLFYAIAMKNRGVLR